MAILQNFLLSSSIAMLAVSIWLCSSDFKPVEFHLPPPPKLIGPLALNRPKVLEKLMEGQLRGPESIVVEGNTLYTCTTDGKCLKIVEGKIVKSIPITKHKGCEEMSRQSIAYCGRPLGIRRRNSKQFIVADAVLGIFGVNFDDESVELFLPISARLAGLPMMFPDDFDFIDNDTIVFSDASTRYGYSDFIMSFLEHSGDGRIIKLKLSTGEMELLIDGMNFPNGVQMHTDKQSVLFCESASARVHRFHFAGPKKGRLEVFAENLPGFPDNIRISSAGTSFYVALFSHRSVQTPDIFQRMGAWPMARKVVGEFIKFLPRSMVKSLFLASHSSYGIVLELDLDGRPIRSFHDPEGKVIKDISQVTDDGGNFIYLASFDNKYIGRMSKN